MATEMRPIPKTPRTPGLGKTPRRQAKNNSATDPVEVYCRVKPLSNKDEESCVQMISEKVIQLTPHKNCFRAAQRQETRHTFQHVFDEKCSQKELFDRVAMPCVEDLIQGKNGLIFAYGITGSGKTYTMNGPPTDTGLLPRCLDVIFNSIGDYQAKRCVFKPDKANGVDLLTESEAKLERERRDRETACAPVSATPSRGKKNVDMDLGDIIRLPDSSKVDKVDEDNMYAVFVSYTEIYNNYIYDLLDETPIDPICPKPPTSKSLREDYNKNMYVSGVTEVEVKSSEEAYEVFMKGQKLRRVANTTLNMESSRSHSVFSVKLVQAPLDPDGEDVLQDKTQVAVSMLNLCDLAGSERTNRTKAGGDRLREAGNINSSLMTLRNCIEILRENQSCTDGANLKMVPYRVCKLTHLFKNFFDGEGKVRMIVTLNPSNDDYDESLHVMKFAELTQEVVVARQTSVQFDTGLTPGRRRANQLYKEALAQVEEVTSSDGFSSSESTPRVVAKPIQNMGPPFPFMELKSPDDANTLVKLLEFLKDREKRRKTLIEDLCRKQGVFRAQLMDFQNDNTDLSKVVAEKDAIISEKEKEIHRLERRVKAFQQKNEILEQEKKRLVAELDDQKKRADREKQDKMKLKQTLKGVVTSEKDKWQKECAKRVHDKEVEMEARVWQKEEKLRQLKEIVQHMPKNKGDGPKVRSKSPPPTRSRPPLKNKLHRRSKSSDCWIEHKTANLKDTGALLQPNIKKKRTVVNPQEKDFKKTQGEVFKSVGGGTSVAFTDVETMKMKAQEMDSSESSLESLSPRKRKADETTGSESSWTDIETRCSYAIEGRPGMDPACLHTAPKYRKT